MHARDYTYSEKEFEDIQSNYNGKAEYCNGHVVLSSSTSIKHNEIITNLSFNLTSYLKGSKCKAYTESIEVIFRKDNEVYKFKPDVFVECEDASREGQSFTSAPKIVFEVISKSTASHDYITKLDIYQRFGVQEYNIVEQDGHIVQYTLTEGQYRISNTFKDNDTYVSTFFEGLKIKLEDIFE